MLHKLCLALAATLLAVSAVSGADTASARVTTDDAGDVASYERLHRFNRGRTIIPGDFGP
jgi:hypothetical protein